MNITEIWNFFLVHPMLSLFVGAYDLLHDFGLAIVLVTVAIRLLLYPLYVSQIRSQRVMQELAPAMNELKAKHGKDRQKLSEEQMKLYKERGYNPAMGCFPLLVQLPFLFAVYAALLQFQSITSDQLSQILLPFVPNPGSVDTSAHWLPWLTEGLQHKDPLYILPIIAGATQLIASIMAQPAAQPKSVDPQQRMMQSMMYYFPAITVVIASGLPAGLALYWVTGTIFQIAQQYVVTGWGRLVRFAPFLRNVPTPADRSMRAREQAALVEARVDMGDAPRGEVATPIDAPGAQRARSRRRAAKKEKGRRR
ncbi:MAG: YidC/Oxa1 family membrane protein insertase [Candidatus Limnocylindria bacterium]